MRVLAVACKRDCVKEWLHKPARETNRENCSPLKPYAKGWLFLRQVRESLLVRIAYSKIIWLLLLFACFQAETVFAVSLGDRVQVSSSIGVTVRQSAGGTPFANGQPNGALGVTTSGPQYAQVNGTGTTYEWWNVDFDTGQDGWVAIVNCPAVVPTSAPTLIYPGNGSSVPTTPTLTPTFSWNAVRGATSYELNVQTGNTYPINGQNVGNTTSFTPSSGVLQPGLFYVWNMRAHDSAGYSVYSSGTSGVFYFQTPSAPTATTVSPPISITATSATLTGNLNANGASTSYYFQYGLTASYGSTTLAYSIGTGSGNYGIAISGLTAGTVYHYRVVAYNAVNTTTGLDAQFQTSGQTYSITTSPSPTAGGTTSGDGNYTSGQSVTVTATPNTASGYGFVN